MSKKEHYLMRDNIAKKIFKDKELGKELTARLISIILKADYQEIYDNLTPSFTDIGINALTVDSDTDIMYETNDNIINIEINYSYGPTRKAQLNGYVTELYLGQLKSSKSYKSAKGVIQILIEDYDFFHKGELLYEVVLKDNKYNLLDDEFFKRFRISLDYLSKLNYNEVIKSDNKLVKLLYFLICNNKEERDKVYKDDEFMEKVIKNAEEIAGRAQMPLFLSNEEITRLDMEYHQKVGFDKGVEQKQREMIINLYQNGVSLDLISKSSNLSIGEVKKILNDKKIDE